MVLLFSAVGRRLARLIPLAQLRCLSLLYGARSSRSVFCVVSALPQSLGTSTEFPIGYGHSRLAPTSRQISGDIQGRFHVAGFHVIFCCVDCNGYELLAGSLNFGPGG